MNQTIQLTKTMTTADLISAALKNPATKGITLYWDKQVPGEHGPAYRAYLEAENGDAILNESGPLDLVRWEGDSQGMNVEDFFRGPDGAYLGPDEDGVYPILIAA